MPRACSDQASISFDGLKNNAPGFWEHKPQMQSPFMLVRNAEQGQGTELRACQFQALVRRPSMQEPASKKLEAPHTSVSQLIRTCYFACFVYHHVTKQPLAIHNGKHRAACMWALIQSLTGVMKYSNRSPLVCARAVKGVAEEVQQDRLPVDSGTQVMRALGKQADTSASPQQGGLHSGAHR